MVPWDHPIHHSKRHLDRVRRFSRIDGHYVTTDLPTRRTDNVSPTNLEVAGRLVAERCGRDGVDLVGEDVDVVVTQPRHVGQRQCSRDAREPGRVSRPAGSMSARVLRRDRRRICTTRHTHNNLFPMYTAELHFDHTMSVEKQPEHHRFMH